MVQRFTSPTTATQDPSRRRTEIYMRPDEQKEHFKLRADANEDLQAIDKLHEAASATDTTTEDKMNELFAANAATQATVAAIADDNWSIKAMLTQLLKLQSQPTETATETENTEQPKLTTETETKTEIDTETEPKRKLNTENTTALLRMGVLQDRKQTTHSHDLPMTALFTEIENSNVLRYTDHCQYCDSDQRSTVDPFSLYVHYKNNDQGKVIDRIEELFSVKQSATAYKTSATTLVEEL